MSKIKAQQFVCLVILDGWGEWDTTKGNAILEAKLPTIEELNKYYPKVLLQASGLSVGLPWGVCGNSEVGHQTIGTGQIIYQYLPAINISIENKTFEKNEALLEAIEYSKKNKSCLHLIGLVSDGGVHSHIHHLYALLELAKKKKCKQVCIHAITDGRDTEPKSAKKYIEDLHKAIKEVKIGQIASISGRYYTMDRNNNWDRVEKAFIALTEGTRIKEKDPIQAIEAQYKRGITDEYLEPMTMVDDKGELFGLIKDNDAVICFNFRKDRSRQITQAFTDTKFDKFKTPCPRNIKYTCFVEYEKGINATIAFPEQNITARLGQIISENKLSQLRIAETEKFAHVTYFFNGGKEEPYPGEERVIVPSKKVTTYAEAPLMSAEELTNKVLAEIDKEKYNFILLNFANPDMVGHTGDFKAGIKACEATDEYLNKIIAKVKEKNGNLIITADHGNVEEMINLTNFEPDTEHSTNPVPCWIVTPENRKSTECEDSVCNIDGLLIDIAPTVLKLLGLKQPKDMVGRDIRDFCR